MAKPGPKGKEYTTERVVFRLHSNVEAEIDKLRGCTCPRNDERCKCGAEDRSAWLTKVVAEKVQRDLAELLVPNKPEFTDQTTTDEELREIA
ncbi:hypothetical protein ACFVVM_32950 [Nocardia sp. NPDC058176]|uniref:hypothetical protein n=1 Tax=Nocardia sp. NPDC058176 TaxID=3346368 RepID=UPI0036DEAAD0